MAIKYFSMFSGIGGFEYGIGTKGQCVGYSEIDKYAISIYKRQYPEHRNYENATRINTAELRDFDLLVGGFPCQAFSIAGKRKGFMDTRGTLFFEIARILSDCRPRYFLLENVQGLLSHESGKTFQSIIGILADLGYRIEWQVLNTKDYGLPQNRERIFIAGYFGKGNRPQVFPIATNNGQNENPKRELKEITQGQSQGYRVYDSNGLSTSLASQAGGIGAKTGLYAMRGRENGQQFESGIRRLTPLECERLQGFPDNWTEYGIDKNGNEIKISDTQRYKCLGNAVSTNVIEAIFNKWKI